MSSSSSSIASRRDEIVAKKAKLAELKRQRELRQREFTSHRQSVGVSGIGHDTSELAQSSPLRHRSTTSHQDIDSLISSLVPDRPSPSGTRSPAGKTGVGSSTNISNNNSNDDDAGDEPAPRAQYQDAATDTQTLSFTDLTTVYEIPVETKPEVIYYSKGIQTTEAWQDIPSEDETTDVGAQTTNPPRRRRKLSQRAQHLEEEEIRQRLRLEIEEEIRALKLNDSTATQPGKERFPTRPLAPEELSAVTSSSDFLDFIERSSKVIERALDEEYDVLADYALQARDAEEDEDGFVGRRGRRIKEIAQFDLSDSMGRKRMISALDFSPKFPELLCTAYTKSQASPHTPPGLLNIWNLHLKGRPEYSLHATSDLLSVLFHPHHPSLLLGGTYSGQLCLWDTRARHHRTGEPVQKTPLTGGRTGHAHPIYSLAVVGTQNASSIISVSTDGVVCAWSTDMLTVPQEYLDLHAPHPSQHKTDDIAPTSIDFPASDPTYFLAGTEQGAIHPVHRYDRAGAKAGLDARTAYTAHTAPITSLAFHPARGGPVDLGDLFLSSSWDWSIKLWRARPPSPLTSTSSSTSLDSPMPILDIQREDTIYDVRWSPSKPSIFGCVDGAGTLDVYDLLVSTEVPVASARPSHQEKGLSAGGAAGLGFAGREERSLNKLAWEKTQGRNVAVGGLDGVTTVFEVGTELGGVETRQDAWVGVRKWVARQQQSQSQGQGLGRGR